MKTPKISLSASGQFARDASARSKLLASSEHIPESSSPSGNSSVSDRKGPSAADRITKKSDESNYNFRYPLSHIHALRRHIPSFPGLGTPYLIFQTIDSVWQSPLYFMDGGVRTLLRTLESFVAMTKSSTDDNLYIVNDANELINRRTLRNLLDPASDKPIQDLIPPSSSQKKSTPNVINSKINSNDPPLTSSSPAKGGLFSVFDSLVQSFSSSPKLGAEKSISRSKAPEEIVANVSGVHLDLGTFELVEDEKITAPTLPVVSRGKILTPSDFAKLRGPEGRIVEVPKLRETIFYGGIAPELRKELWKYLLGYYPWETSEEERASLRVKKCVEYEKLKMQWQSVSEEQAAHWRKFTVNKERVEKDVPRTNADHEYFERNDCANVNVLYSILMSYVFFNWDLGYVQGMSDLLAPILVVMDDEVDAFCCFKGLMDEKASNFNKDQGGINRQLAILEKLLSIMDAELHEYLKQKGCLNMFFVYRWILLMFKREFAFEDMLLLWDSLLSKHLSPEFHLFLVIALLIQHRQPIIDQRMDFDDLIQYAAQLAGKMNVVESLNFAVALFFNFEKTTDDELKNEIFLRCGNNCTREQIVAEYRARSLLLHPDKTGTDSAEGFTALNEAYATLLDENMRKQYDIYLKLDPGIPFKKFLELELGSTLHWMYNKSTESLTAPVSASVGSNDKREVNGDQDYSSKRDEGKKSGPENSISEAELQSRFRSYKI